ncbi:MAG: rRNA maturation RNase YbeY [Flavobacteriaceae bacterium]
MQKKIIKFLNIPDNFDTKKLSVSLSEYVKVKGYDIKKLQYNFVSKEALLKMNKKYLNHKTHTDIITFNYSSDSKLEAEFFVSCWAINRSAKEHRQTAENETLRVIIHGVLHCMGYNDNSNQEIGIMRKMEDKFISMFHAKHNRYV